MNEPRGVHESAGLEPPSAAVDRVYFPELDGLRFLAFLMIYLFHGGVHPDLLTRLISASGARIFYENGRFGVQLFFILSGYLITALLLREESIHGRISLGAFWIRRVLRIWPLYYSIVAIGFFVIPVMAGLQRTREYREMLRIHLLPFLGFSGNWSMAIVAPITSDALGILWSVCVEEQFYLVAPLLIAWVRRRYRIGLVLALMAGSIAVRYLCARYSNPLMVMFNTFAQLDSMLSGVLLALFLGWERERPRLRRWLRVLQWPILATSVWVINQPSLGQGSPWRVTVDYVEVWLCGIGIISIAVWGRGWLQRFLAFSQFVWLGKISYGLYMYHEIVLPTRRYFERELPWFPNKDELMAIAALGVTIAMAAASYYCFEMPFLRLKRMWTRVPSRPV